MRCIALALAITLGLAACDPVSGTDQKRAFHEWHEIEQRNRELEARKRADIPLIPLDKAVGCDVCPHLCRYVDLRPLPILELGREYRRAAVQYGHVDGMAQRNAWEQVEALACIVKRGSAEMQQAFLRLLASEDIAVRYCAAVHALQHGLATDEPLAVLRAIAASETDFAVSARIRLQDWDAGIPVAL